MIPAATSHRHPNVRRPKHYPTICPDEGNTPDSGEDEAVFADFYDPRPMVRTTVAIDRARAGSKAEAAAILAELATRRGLQLVTGFRGLPLPWGNPMVYSTARKWFCFATPGRESTYTSGFSNPPAEAK